jgi:protein TonB
MIHHSKSLLLSIVIHAIILVGIFYTFHKAISFVGHKKEQKVCIKLASISSVQSQHSKPPKKIVKKKHNIVKKRVHFKKLKPKRVKPLLKPKKHLKVPKIKKAQKQEVIQKDTSKKEKSKEFVKKVEKKSHLPKEAQKKSREKESSQKRYEKNYLAEIAKYLQENLYYPRRARKRGIEGIVVVKFTLMKDATVVKSKIISSSSDILSRAALKTLKNLSGSFPKPDRVLTLTVPIRYSLE